jgi:hypothetical protein
MRKSRPPLWLGMLAGVILVLIIAPMSLQIVSDGLDRADTRIAFEQAKQAGSCSELVKTN